MSKRNLRCRNMKAVKANSPKKWRVAVQVFSRMLLRQNSNSIESSPLAFREGGTISSLILQVYASKQKLHDVAERLITDALATVEAHFPGYNDNLTGVLSDAAVSIFIVQ